MRHRKAGVKLNRTSSHRSAMFRNMVTSLFKHERIRTTDAKAKEVRRWADRMITLAKRGDLHARRQVLSVIREKEVVHKLFAQVDERFGELTSGYTRVVKLGRRPGDAAPVSLVELVVPAPEKKKKRKKKPAKASVKKKAAPEKQATGSEKEAAPAERETPEVPEKPVSKTEKPESAQKEESERP